MPQDNDHTDNNEISEQVEDQDIETKTNEVAGYKVKSFDYLPAQYQSLVYSTWLHSLRDENPYFKLIDSKSYYKNYSQYLAKLFLRPFMILKVAVLADDEDVVLGWSVSEIACLHYVFVKKDFQKLGIAKSLMDHDFKVVSHLPASGFELETWREKYPNVIFNPFY